MRTYRREHLSPGDELRCILLLRFATAAPKDFSRAFCTY